MANCITISDTLKVLYDVEFGEELNSLRIHLEVPNSSDEESKAGSTPQPSLNESDASEQQASVPVTPFWLHWGLAVQRLSEWISPNSTNLTVALQFPAELTKKWDDKASQTTIVPNDPPICISVGKEAKGINFVVKMGDTWFNNEGRDYHIRLCEPPKGLPSGHLGEIIARIIEVEVEYGSWTLWHRYMECRKILEQHADRDTIAILVVWMRYSNLAKLDWQRNYNTRPALLSADQKNTTLAITKCLRTASKDEVCSQAMLLRLLLGQMGKGGDHGQRIRDEILRIMHRNAIKKTYGTFYEQWHQKLHNNTTPDDIGICEAVIAFNETNDMSRYWQVLTDHGITRERLESFDRNITQEPVYEPQSVNCFKNYLALLKSVHSATDLAMMIDGAQWALTDAINDRLNTILANNEHWDVFAQIQRVTEVRRILPTPDDPNACRDVVYMDIALEAYVRQLCEKVAHVEMDLAGLRHQLCLLFDNLLITNTNTELAICVRDWNATSVDDRVSEVLFMKSVLDRVSRYLGSFVDEFNEMVQTRAEYIGQECGIDEPTVLMFSEELIRGSIWFAVSQLIRKIGPKLREKANLGSWQVISPYTSTGTLRCSPSLQPASAPTILASETIHGDEEVPENVTGVLTPMEVDVLAHLSVRARNNKVYLGVCYDPAEWEEVQKSEGRFVQVSGMGRLEEVKEIAVMASATKVVVKPPTALERLAVTSAEFGPGVTGAKGNNCARLHNELPLWINVPESVALPFRVFEKVLDDAPDIKATLDDLLSATDLDLPAIKESVMALECPEAVRSEIWPVLQSIEVDDWNEAWSSIKRVWASKFNERALLSTKKAGITLSDIFMSVLIQKVIPSDYAYVIHTTNPMNGNAEELYAEVVVGMGETLVGAYPGRALGLIVEKTSREHQIVSYPNKSVALHSAGFMFRSDSNSEDLAGFAGAGLFDSFSSKSTEEIQVEYGSAEIARSEEWAFGVAQKLLDIGLQIERLYGEPQDIEGCIVGDKYYVVQTRPQV